MKANSKTSPSSATGDASQKQPGVWIPKRTDSPSFLAEAVPLTQAALNPSSSKQAFLAHYNVGIAIHRWKSPTTKINMKWLWHPHQWGVRCPSSQMAYSSLCNETQIVIVYFQPVLSLSLLSKEVSDFVSLINCCLLWPPGPLFFCSTEPGGEGGMEGRGMRARAWGGLSRGSSEERWGVFAVWEGNGWKRKELKKRNIS